MIMKRLIKNTIVAVSLLLCINPLWGQPGDTIVFDPNLHIYLLVGQSNMEGAMATAEEIDKVTHPRVFVLGRADCEETGQIYNKWSLAKTPLNGCGPESGVGPGDYFAKTIIELNQDITIGLVPCAFGGADIDLFRKDVVAETRANFWIPPDNTKAGVYDFIIERMKLAQQYGVVKGILFHQGEANTGEATWPGEVAEVIQDIRTDLNLDTADVPVLIGQLYTGDNPLTTWTLPHKVRIDEAVALIPNAHIVSSEGLELGSDNVHFDTESQREFGKRYAQVMTAIYEDLAVKGVSLNEGYRVA